MDAANPFAQSPLTPEPVIEQVRRQLRAEAAADWPSGDTLVDGLVDRVVRGLWSSRVKTFVPILALRESRELLRGERASILLAAPDAPVLATAPSPAALRDGHMPGDRVGIGRDTLPIDWRDALRVDDDVMPL